MKASDFFLIALVFMFIFSACGAGVSKNNQGTASFKNEDYQSARDHYIEALLENPESLTYRYNLAISNMAGEKLSDAQKELDAIEKSYEGRKITDSDGERLFKLYFAQAFVHGLVQNFDEALSYYQRALDIKDSREVRKNIELLIQLKKKQGKDGDPSNEKKKGEIGRASCRER